MAYEPGDSFDVFCPNRATEVEEMLHRLGLHDQRNHQVHISLKKDHKKKGQSGPVTSFYHAQLMYTNYAKLHSSDNILYVWMAHSLLRFAPWL